MLILEIPALVSTPGDKWLPSRLGVQPHEFEQSVSGRRQDQGFSPLRYLCDTALCTLRVPTGELVYTRYPHRSTVQSTVSFIGNRGNRQTLTTSCI